MPYRMCRAIMLLISRGVKVLLSAIMLAGGAAPTLAGDAEATQKIVLLPPGPDNPRNSEGDFITLRNGRILFIYTHFTGGAGDHAAAHLAARFSDDGGKTWSERDAVIVPNEGKWNVMSVSLLRLADGRIALFYLEKNSTKDCRPVMRVSSDEAKTWTDPVQIVPNEEVDYYVLNNDRVIELQHGPQKCRLIAPLAQHSFTDDRLPPGKATCYFSDDAGATWQRSSSTLTHDADGRRINLQEPGVVELKDSALLMFIRTPEGSQYLARSTDGGQTWSPAAPSSIRSPLSPASIERIPSTGDLLLVWNDHENVPASLKNKRTPLAAAISTDDGRTWTRKKLLESDPDGWYCYTAIHFVDGDVLLAYCAGKGRAGGLNTTQITRFPIDWLYR